MNNKKKNLHISTKTKQSNQLLFFGLELKGARGKSDGKQEGRRKTGCNFSSFGLYISNS